MRALRATHPQKLVTSGPVQVFALFDDLQWNKNGQAEDYLTVSTERGAKLAVATVSLCSNVLPHSL